MIVAPDVATVELPGWLGWVKEFEEVT